MKKSMGISIFWKVKKKHYSFERYFHFKNNYDYTIYIDNDVYIYPEAKRLPVVNGLMNVREPEGNSSNIFRKVNNLDNSYSYFNSGVTFCDNSTATRLSEYMINRLNKNIIPKGKNSDNMLLNEFILQEKNSFSELSCKWNYMPFLPNSEKTDNPNFFHFLGIQGKMIINKLQDKNINILDFLQKAKKRSFF